MIRNSVNLSCLCALFLMTTQAFSEDRTGVVVSAGIGSSVIHDKDGTETFRGTDFAYSFAAEYRFNKNISIGMTVFNLGTASDTIGGTPTEIEVDGFDFFGRYIFPLGASVEGYGLVGAAVYQADARPGGFSGLFGEDAWEIGGGLDFFLNENTAIRFEGRFLNGPRDESGGLFTLGLSYGFY